MKTARRSRQRGFSGLLVIAALVLFGGMAVYGVSAVTSVHTGFAQEVASARAKRAAEAGMDWARYQVLTPPGPAAPNCFATQTLTLPSTLAIYRVTVTCNRQNLSDNGPVRIYQLTATACNIPGPAGCPNAAGGTDYVEKRVSAWEAR